MPKEPTSELWKGVKSKTDSTENGSKPESTTGSKSGSTSGSTTSSKTESTGPEFSSTESTESTISVKTVRSKTLV